MSDPAPLLAVDFAELEPVAGTPALEYLEHHGLLPVDVTDGVARVVAWRDPIDVQALDDMALALHARLEVTRVPDAAAAEAVAALRRLYGREATTASALIDGLGAAATAQDLAAAIDLEHIPLDDLVSLANEPPVVRLVNMFLIEALDARASDVHLEHYASRIRVRYRVDGVLRDVAAPPPRMAPAIVSRLKIMAHLDVAERRLPQDGRIRLRLKDREVDVRVSTVPTLHGESLVLRLLDRERGRISLAELGMADDTRAAFEQAISRPHGIVLVTGPTGSGKTTTLYAAIDHIRTGREKILTVEDPVEYELEGVPQVAVNGKVGLTFARALRALLRQDPDVLLVGEIRDEETAEIAVHAALTGHLVLSTLHTNDAVGAITRLLDLGVPAYLLASTIEAVLAQRLVRKLCRVCGGGGKADPSDGAIRCVGCGGVGFRGRTGIYEVLLVDEALRQAIHDRPDPVRLRSAAADGMRDLASDGERLVREGATSSSEIVRVCRA